MNRKAAKLQRIVDRMQVLQAKMDAAKLDFINTYGSLKPRDMPHVREAFNNDIIPDPDNGYGVDRLIGDILA